MSQVVLILGVNTQVPSDTKLLFKVRVVRKLEVAPGVTAHRAVLPSIPMVVYVLRHIHIGYQKRDRTKLEKSRETDYVWKSPFSTWPRYRRVKFRTVSYNVATRPTTATASELRGGWEKATAGPFPDFSLLNISLRSAPVSPLKFCNCPEGTYLLTA